LGSGKKLSFNPFLSETSGLQRAVDRGAANSQTEADEPTLSQDRTGCLAIEVAGKQRNVLLAFQNMDDRRSL
jgi:hypothetical protein